MRFMISPTPADCARRTCRLVRRLRFLGPRELRVLRSVTGPPRCGGTTGDNRVGQNAERAAHGPYRTQRTAMNAIDAGQAIRGQGFESPHHTPSTSPSRTGLAAGAPAGSKGTPVLLCD